MFNIRPNNNYQPGSYLQLQHPSLNRPWRLCYGNILSWSILCHVFFILCSFANLYWFSLSRLFACVWLDLVCENETSDSSSLPPSASTEVFEELTAAVQEKDSLASELHVRHIAIEQLFKNCAKLPWLHISRAGVKASSSSNSSGGGTVQWDTTRKLGRPVGIDRPIRHYGDICCWVCFREPGLTWPMFLWLQWRCKDLERFAGLACDLNPPDSQTIHDKGLSFSDVTP